MRIFLSRIRLSFTSNVGAITFAVGFFAAPGFGQSGLLGLLGLR